MQKKCPWSLCLPTKSDLLLSNTARLKLSYPATPPPYPPLTLLLALTTNNLPPLPHTTPHKHTHIHTTPTFATTRWSSRLSFCRSSLGYFSPESVQTFQTASYLCKSSGTKKTKNIVKPWLQAILKKQKTRHFKQNCLSLQIRKLKENCTPALTK